MLCFVVLTATPSAAANPPSPLTYHALGNEYLMSRTHVYQARNDLLPSPSVTRRFLTAHIYLHLNPAIITCDNTPASTLFLDHQFRQISLQDFYR